MYEGEYPDIKRDQDLGEIVLRGQKKQKSPKQWNKGTQNKLRKLRDADREAETRRLYKEKSTAIEEYEIDKFK